MLFTIITKQKNNFKLPTLLFIPVADCDCNVTAFIIVSVALSSPFWFVFGHQYVQIAKRIWHKLTNNVD
jgi:hypothetical protein